MTHSEKPVSKSQSLRQLPFMLASPTMTGDANWIQAVKPRWWPWDGALVLPANILCIKKNIDPNIWNSVNPTIIPFGFGDIWLSHRYPIDIPWLAQLFRLFSALPVTARPSLLVPVRQWTRSRWKQDRPGELRCQVWWWIVRDLGSPWWWYNLQNWGFYGGRFTELGGFCGKCWGAYSTRIWVMNQSWLGI